MVISNSHAASLSWPSHESTKILWNACRFVEPRHLYLTDSRRIPLLSSLCGVLPNPRPCTIAQTNIDAPIQHRSPCLIRYNFGFVFLTWCRFLIWAHPRFRGCRPAFASTLCGHLTSSHHPNSVNHSLTTYLVLFEFVIMSETQEGAQKKCHDAVSMLEPMVSSMCRGFSFSAPSTTVGCLSQTQRISTTSKKKDEIPDRRPVIDLGAQHGGDWTAFGYSCPS
jgi:hypothetical protein